jgi:two-component system, NtrC family, sensor histidine kinase HydH
MDIMAPGNPVMRWIRLVRPQDAVWVILFILLGIMTEADRRSPSLYIMIAGLAAVQILETKIPAMATVRGRVGGIAIKFVICWLVIGYTHGVDSRYWPVLLLPVVSAGTTFGILGTLAVAVLAALIYLSFLSFVQLADWENFLPDVLWRVIFLTMAGNLAYILAENLRTQTREAQRNARDLALANEQIQEAMEAVRRSDRLAALGQLSAGLAHELRNPMGTIRASAEMLSRNLTAENEVAREVAGFISSEVDRANSLITRFLQFARPLELRPERADLTQTLDHAVAMAEREAPGIAIYRNYAPEIAPFPFDAELLERVFYNLILNAAQATPAGGAVTLKARAAEGFAEISVIDRGSGIDPKHMDTIFNPFFTTKPTGVGLGLAIVSKIVDEHGGKITVESEPGKGTIFRVLLPTEPRPSGSGAVTA